MGGGNGVLPDGGDGTVGGGDDDDDDDHHHHDHDHHHHHPHGSMPESVDEVNELGEERVADAVTEGVLDDYQRRQPVSAAEKTVRISLAAAAVLAFSGVVIYLKKQQSVHMADEQVQLIEPVE